MPLTLIHTRSEWQVFRETLHGPMVLVPTMGALHEGHLSLIRLAKSHADHVIVSIFVNPTQFGPNEDFDRYPRTKDADIALLEEMDVTAVFYPSTEDIYPNGPASATRVYVPEWGKRYCGKSRPDFFEGVCSVVLRLFLLVRPTHTIFGEKDFQQAQIITRMAQDLFLPIQIIKAPIVRESDGLAMSSRNRYLSPEDRTKATQIYAMLHALQQTAPSPITTALQDSITALAHHGVRTDYLVLIDSTTLEEVTLPTPGTRLLFAGYVGHTRLIDTMAMGG